MAQLYRRKSLGLFRPTLPAVSTGTSDNESANSPEGSNGHAVVKKKSGRTRSIFPSRSTPASPSIPDSEATSSDRTGFLDTSKLRPKLANKSNRSSLLGSLISLRGSEDGDGLTRTNSKGSSADGEDQLPAEITRGVFGNTVLRHGEVQTSGGMFRKKSHYVVLTETYLLRFKGQSKAAEMYPVIPASIGRSAGHRQSMASFGSNHEVQSTLATDIVDGICLSQVIAISKLEDGRPYFSIEVSHLDEASGKASSLTMQLSDPKDSKDWLSAITKASAEAKAGRVDHFSPAVLRYVAQALEQDHDYDPQHFRLAKVVQRACNKAGNKPSIDDLAKQTPTFCYLAVGINKMHLIPLNKVKEHPSASSLSDLDAPTSFGLMNLSAITLQPSDDSFQITFRSPLQNTTTLYLASVSAREILIWLKSRIEYLRPTWVHQPVTLYAQLELEEAMMAPVEMPDDEHHCFEQTLIAYCAAFNVDVSNIRYMVDYHCDDAPCFRLLKSSGSIYTALELLAVMKSLRYNESFSSISFAGISLDVLQGIYDLNIDADALTTRSGNPIQLPGQPELPVLSQEIRALALKSRKLRRLDFSYCLSPRQRSDDSGERSACGIPEALAPLCKKTLTNVDWIALNGIRLGDSDMDHLVDAASQRLCHLRGLELGNCGLSVHDIDVLLSALAVHESTMEVLDISAVQGRLSPELFQRQIGYFGHMRKLNLARVQKTLGPESLIAPEILLAWRLEELQLGQANINQETVDSIAAYLSSPQSDSLHFLELDQCGLTGKDLAVFFTAMVRVPGQGRIIHISASENRLRIDHAMLFQAIAQNNAPSHLTMRMIEFEKEYHFRDLVQALQKNTSLRVLDISKASLPLDVTDETCELLRKLFETNSTLEELDISGEQAHLESAQFGIKLNLALTGLKKNQTLKVLKIEHQNLGVPGADTLAEVMEVNTGLIEIHCENNEITLQSFTVLVNGLEKNRSITYMPTMARDRQRSLEKIRREIAVAQQGTSATHSASSSVLKQMNKMTKVTGALGRSNRPSLAPRTNSPAIVYTDQDVRAAVAAINEKWDAEVARMQSYLARNMRIAQGLPEGEVSSVPRPQTAESLGDVLRKAKLDSTPTLEKEIGLGIMDEKLELTPTKRTV